MPPRRPGREHPLSWKRGDSREIKQEKQEAYEQLLILIDDMETLGFTHKWKSRHVVFVCRHGKFEKPFGDTLADYRSDRWDALTVIRLRAEHRRECGKE